MINKIKEDMSKLINELKEIIDKQLNEISKKMQAMKEKFNKHKNSEKNQIEILEMKSSVSQKNSGENLANRVDQDRLLGLEDKVDKL
jgi:flagellar biosynthesis chaperone FliJ